MVGKYPITSSNFTGADSGGSEEASSSAALSPDDEYEYYIIAKRISDGKIILERRIKNNFKYVKVMPTLLHCLFADKISCGIIFESTTHTKNFINAIITAFMEIEEEVMKEKQASCKVELDGKCPSLYIANNSPTLENENQSQNTYNNDNCSETLSSCYLPTVPRQRDDLMRLQDAINTIKEAKRLFTEILNENQTPEDDFDRFGKILVNKLRKLPEIDSLRMMYEIDGLFIRHVRMLLCRPTYIMGLSPTFTSVSELSS